MDLKAIVEMQLLLSVELNESCRTSFGVNII